ncbi:Uncharacterised protein [Legionella pneumophila]|nr:Uncharacterised protein [Legionella pneumophila]
MADCVIAVKIINPSATAMAGDDLLLTSLVIVSIDRVLFNVKRIQNAVISNKLPGNNVFKVSIPEL